MLFKSLVNSPFFCDHSLKMNQACHLRIALSSAFVSFSNQRLSKMYVPNESLIQMYEKVIVLSKHSPFCIILKNKSSLVFSCRIRPESAATCPLVVFCIDTSIQVRSGHLAQNLAKGNKRFRVSCPPSVLCVLVAGFWFSHSFAFLVSYREKLIVFHLEQRDHSIYSLLASFPSFLIIYSYNLCIPII